MRFYVTVEYGVLSDFLQITVLDTILADTILLQIFEVGMAMASFEGYPDELRLCFARVEIDGAVVVWTGSGLEKLSVVFAYDLVNGPVHLLAGYRAVVNDLAVAAELRTDAIAHGANSLTLRSCHVSGEYCRIGKRARDCMNLNAERED